MELMTVAQLAEFLQMTPRQIYSMTETRTRTGSMRANPLPKLNLHGNLRFNKVAVLEWLKREEASHA